MKYIIDIIINELIPASGALYIPMNFTEANNKTIDRIALIKLIICGFSNCNLYSNNPCPSPQKFERSKKAERILSAFDAIVSWFCESPGARRIVIHFENRKKIIDMMKNIKILKRIIEEIMLLISKESLYFDRNGISVFVWFTVKRLVRVKVKFEITT
jgi:hypothetical protein